MKTKICKKCGKELPLDNFYKSKNTKDGYEGKCKECRKKLSKIHTIICKNCGKSFSTDDKNAKFCSSRCCGDYQKKRIIVKCDYCGKNVERIPSSIGEHNFCDATCMGKFTSNKTIVKCDYCGKEFEQIKSKTTRSNNHFCSQECYHKWHIGENNSNWNYDLTDEDRIKERNMLEDKQWRKQVFERDNYTCQCCGDNKGGNLNAHHKDGYHWCEERRHDVTNGVTLCEDCHKEFHSIYGYRNNTEEQYKEFINNRDQEKVG